MELGSGRGKKKRDMIGSRPMGPPVFGGPPFGPPPFRAPTLSRCGAPSPSRSPTHLDPTLLGSSLLLFHFSLVSLIFHFFVLFFHFSVFPFFFPFFIFIFFIFPIVLRLFFNCFLPPFSMFHFPFWKGAGPNTKLVSSLAEEGSTPFNSTDMDRQLRKWSSAEQSSSLHDVHPAPYSWNWPAT